MIPSTLHISLALLLATLSLAASITFLTTFPARQETSLRHFFVAWVAVSGAIFWLMASAFLVRLFRGRKSEPAEPSSRRVEPTGGAKYFKNGTRAPTISRPIPQTLTCNTIPASSMPSTSTMTTTSSMPSFESPFAAPFATSSRRNLLMRPEFPPQLPSTFSPFSFHPPDEGSLYPHRQHPLPPRSDSLAVLGPSTPPTTTIPPKSTFDEILSEFAKPASPSQESGRSSLTASTASDVSSSASLRRCVSRRLLAPPPEAHIAAKSSNVSGWSPGQNLKDVHQRVMAKSGKSLPLLPGDDGTWYRCHLREGGAGHRLSTSSI